MLSEVEPAAARLLDELYAIHMARAPDFRHEFLAMFTPQERQEAGNYTFHIDNLMRLGLVRAAIAGGVVDYEGILLTEYGRAFVTACRPPGVSDPPIRWATREEVLRDIAERRLRETALENRESP